MGILRILNFQGLRMTTCVEKKRRAKLATSSRMTILREITVLLYRQLWVVEICRLGIELSCKNCQTYCKISQSCEKKKRSWKGVNKNCILRKLRELRKVRRKFTKLWKNANEISTSKSCEFYYNYNCEFHVNYESFKHLQSYRNTRNDIWERLQRELLKFRKVRKLAMLPKNGMWSQKGLDKNYENCETSWSYDRPT